MELRQRHPRRQGDIGEAAAIEWLAAAGAGVSFPLFHSADYDLVADFREGLIRVQAKTSTSRDGDRFRIRLATSGGNRSWTGSVKHFDPARCDFLFVLVADGRQWWIPSQAVEGRHSILLGGTKYSEFEVSRRIIFAADTDPRSTIDRGRGSAGVGEPGSAVNRVPRAEWVRFPPPPSPSGGANGPTATSASGRTRISPQHQLTIPVGPFRAAGLCEGDRMRVEADGDGRILLTRIEPLISDQIALLAGDPSADPGNDEG